ncbi:MAG TPA: sulfotransferase [Alphaproteobacteria bacterium]|nr:sulfotransferase [Alphaproteobacteria bacterium]
MPVFLVGCHRSGTTAARYLLDSHPEIVCPPESKFLTALQEFLGAPQVLPALVSLRLHPSELLAEIGLFARRLLDRSARKSGKRRWIEKTPNYYRILPFIDDIFSGRVLFLFMVRHPLDTIASLQEHFWYATTRHEDPDIARVVANFGAGPYGWARYWREVHETIGVFAASRPDRAWVFKYEEMVADPEGTLARLLAFIGESPAKEQADAAFAAAHDPGYEDPKARVSTSLHTASVGRWRQWPAGQSNALWPIVAEPAARLGYSID